MTAIVPRWEWRTFGDGLGAAEDAFAALTPGHVVESDELYLLAASDGRWTPTAWSGGSRC